MTRALLLLCAFFALATSAAAQDTPAPKVYPNPIVGVGAITVETESTEPAKVELIDVRGRVVPHDQPLAAGTYFVRLRFANGSISEPEPITLVAGGRHRFQLLAPNPSLGLTAGAPAPAFSSLTGPEITTLPADSLGLGDVEVGSMAQDTVFVLNDGTTDLTVSSASLGGAGAFSLLAGGSGGTVGPGDSLEVIVQFAPTSVGAQADTLTIESDDADEPSVEVEVTGTGTAPAMPEIDVSTDSLGFGMEVVGGTRRDTVWVRNLGTATLSVTSSSLTTGGDIAIESGGGPASVPPGDSAAVALAFSPTSTGAQADTLTIASDDADEPSVQVVLTGEGTPVPEPEIRTSTDSLSFGMVVVGDTRRDTVTVYNDGTATLTISSSSLSGGTVFTVESGGGAVAIAPGDSAQVALLFSPTATGVVADSLTILSDDADEPSLLVELTGEGMPVPAPEIELSRDSLGFGDVLLGATAEDTLWVRNIGTADLTLSALSLASGADFAIVSGGAGGVVAAGDSAEVVLSFTPSSLGAASDTLTVPSDDADEPSLLVPLTGAGVAPEIEVAPDSLGFGDVRIDVAATDSVVVRNTGTGPLDLTSITLSSGVDFAIASGGGATTLAAGDSLFIGLTFDPTVLGALSDTLTVASSDDDEPTVQVPLTGTGVAPAILVAPDSLGFGPVDIGMAAQDTVVVRNDGTSDLAISSLALQTGVAFSVLSGGGGTTLSPGDSVVVVVEFAPFDEGAQGDTLSIASDDPGMALVEVPVTGTGVGYPEIAIVPDSLGFGDVLLGASARDSVVVRNEGTGTLTLSSVALSAGAEFVIESGGGARTIAPGDSAQVALLFTPSALGAFSDTLTVESDDADEPSLLVPLTGTGVQPEITVLPDSLGFGDVRLSETARDTVTVRNDGTSPLAITSSTLGAGTAFAVESGGGPVTLAPGDSVQIALAFAPAVVGATADTLTVASDDPDEPSLLVELTGTGVTPEITVAPDSLGLGPVDIGMTAQDTVVVRNDGTADLDISALGLASASSLTSAFTLLSGAGPVLLAPGDSVEVVVQFAPLNEGAQSDTLAIASDDLDEGALSVPLTGTGVGYPEITLSATSLAFGTVQIGEFPPDTVVVRNDGTGTMSVGSVTLGGVAPDAYEIVSGGEGGAVAPGDSLLIVVGFGPIFETEQLATLTITSDDADEPSVDVALSGTGLSPGYVLMYVMGDSQAAGKGDADTSCALRPDAKRRGWYYKRSSDEYIPICSDEMPDEFKSTVMPAIADEVYERYNRIPLIIFYTLKAAPLTPEALPGNDVYWYMGDGSTDQGQAFANARIIFKKGKRTAQNTFASGIEPIAGIHSFGGIDARKWFEEGAGDPDTTFAPRLATFDFILSRSNLTPLYFELGRAPGRPQFEAPLDTFRTVFAETIPADRIVEYDDHVFDQYVAAGSVYDRAGWYADISGHLGSLGLDYLGTEIAIALDLNSAVPVALGPTPPPPASSLLGDPEDPDSPYSLW